MLDNNIVSLEHVTHTLTATSHLPSDFFKHVFSQISESLRRVPTLLLDKVSVDCFEKESINTLLGYWARNKHSSQYVETVSHSEDLTRSGHCLVRRVNDQLCDYIFEQPLCTWQSMRPIHQICLDMEHVYLSMAYRATKIFCQPSQVSSFSTDAVYAHPSKCQKDKLKDAIMAIRHQDQSAVFRISDAPPRLVVTQHDMPITNAFDADFDATQDWNDYAESELQELVDKGHSVLLLGHGGTGKTYAAKAVAKASKKQVLCTAFTHTAAQCIATDGCHGGTLHHCLYRYPNWSGLIIIDEVSQIPLVLWAAIQRWMFCGAQFIYLGDFTQFPPCFNRWRQTDITGTVEDAAFFKTLCGHNRIKFTQYRRGDDPDFFRFYTSLIPLSVEVVINRVREAFPVKQGPPDWTLTISHKQRKAINAKRNEQLRNETGGGVWVPPEQQSDRQGFWLLPNMNLIGVQTENSIVNGQLYKVLNDTKTLQVIGTNETVQLNDARCIRPAHCLVYYSSQGKTLPGRIRMFVGHKKTTTTAIVVGLSRATSKELVDVV